MQLGGDHFSSKLPLFEDTPEIIESVFSHQGFTLPIPFHMDRKYVCIYIYSYIPTWLPSDTQTWQWKIPIATGFPHIFPWFAKLETSILTGEFPCSPRLGLLRGVFRGWPAALMWSGWQGARGIHGSPLGEIFTASPGHLWGQILWEFNRSSDLMYFEVHFIYLTYPIW